jgi:hypothetical protein
MVSGVDADHDFRGWILFLITVKHGRETFVLARASESSPSLKSLR